MLIFPCHHWPQNKVSNAMTLLRPTIVVETERAWLHQSVRGTMGATGTPYREGAVAVLRSEQDSIFPGLLPGL